MGSGEVSLAWKLEGRIWTEALHEACTDEEGEGSRDRGHLPIVQGEGEGMNSGCQ